MLSCLAPTTWGMLLDGGGGGGRNSDLSPASTSFSTLYKQAVQEAASLCGEGAGEGLASTEFGAVTAFSQELQTRSQQGHGPLKQLPSVWITFAEGRLINMGCITSKQLRSITGQELKSTEEPSECITPVVSNLCLPLWSVQHSLWMKHLRQGWC